ncbi:MAG: S8 family serine peptidase [Phycisphaerales bacterium JB040]
MKLDESPLAAHDAPGFALSSPLFDPDRIVARALLQGTPGDPDAAARYELDRFFAVSPAPGWGWMDVISGLPEGAEVLGLESVGELHGFFDDSTGDPTDEESPDDPWFGSQVGLGGGAGGIRILEAWKETKGSSDVVIAVVDAGVSSTHPDLVPQLVTGYNAIDLSSNTDDGSSSHGTHVAGIASATTNNGKGIAGVAYGSKIMPIKAFYSNGFGLELMVADGIRWAADHGADVINMSFGFRTETGALSAAVNYAYDRGVVLVASTGNVPTQQIGLPAQRAEVIGVGALNRTGGLWASTSTGPSLLLVAPGDRVLSTWDTPTQPASYREESGTSMAAPHVAGVAALVLTAEPTLTVDEVWLALANSARDTGHPEFGMGIVDPLEAIRLARSLRSGSCRIDFNGDGVRDGADIADFVQAFLVQDPAADFALPYGMIDSVDIERFLDLYFLGCSK